MPGVEKYLEEKSRKVSVKEKLEEKKNAADARSSDSEKTAKKKSGRL